MIAKWKLSEAAISREYVGIPVCDIFIPPNNFDPYWLYKFNKTAGSTSLVTH